MLSIFKGTSDHSRPLENYLSDSVVETILTGETLDIGYYKPFSDLYVELATTPPAVSNNLLGSYYNGSWTSLNLYDRTNGLSRSGFIKFEKEDYEDWKKTTLHGKELYWLRLSVDTNDLVNIQFIGINLVFADDTDLKEGYSDINEFLPENSPSFIGYHQEARNYILTYLRNKGETIKTQSQYKMLDQFDLHNFEEVRQAAKYLVLANIFYNESDSVDDKWKQKGDGFFKKYSEAINVSFLSIDENDNGKVENNESNAYQYIKVQRL